MMRWSDDRPGGTAGAGGRRRPNLVLLVVALAALLVVALVIATRPGTAATQGRAATTTTAARSTTATPAPTTSAQAKPAAGTAALRDLDEAAATLDEPVVLSSPAAWDQWLPAGKPFPGKDAEEDMATCPRLTDRLEAALGTEMSYWTGPCPRLRPAAPGRRCRCPTAPTRTTTPTWSASAFWPTGRRPSS